MSVPMVSVPMLRAWRGSVGRRERDYANIRGFLGTFYERDGTARSPTR